jgi:hypothetical protein
MSALFESSQVMQHLSYAQAQLFDFRGFMVRRSLLPPPLPVA